MSKPLIPVDVIDHKKRVTLDKDGYSIFTVSHGFQMIDGKPYDSLYIRGHNTPTYNTLTRGPILVTFECNGNIVQSLVKRTGYATNFGDPEGGAVVDVKFDKNKEPTFDKSKTNKIPIPVKTKKSDVQVTIPTLLTKQAQQEKKEPKRKEPEPVKYIDDDDEEPDDEKDECYIPTSQEYQAKQEKKKTETKTKTKTKSKSKSKKAAKSSVVKKEEKKTTTTTTTTITSSLPVQKKKKVVPIIAVNKIDDFTNSQMSQLCKTDTGYGAMPSQADEDPFVKELPVTMSQMVRKDGVDDMVLSTQDIRTILQAEEEANEFRATNYSDM